MYCLVYFLTYFPPAITTCQPSTNGHVPYLLGLGTLRYDSVSSKFTWWQSLVSKWQVILSTYQYVYVQEVHQKTPEVHQKCARNLAHIARGPSVDLLNLGGISPTLRPDLPFMDTSSIHINSSELKPKRGLDHLGCHCLSPTFKAQSLYIVHVHTSQ